ncbi:MAG: DUF2079 domain-containing protein [Candidatus Omnitrophica bacterium]|nr:DUF2079 domain-containing protein [Candidatus Omnitrophota bacterium]
MFFTKWTQHLAFDTHAHDLGLFHSALWNTVHGHFMVDSLRNQIYFSDHLSFFLALLSPFYKLYSGPEILFVGTAAAFAFAFLMFYRFAFERLQEESLALFAALAFALNRYVWGAFLHEFHPDFFAPLFFFLLFLSAYRKRWALFLISLTFILLIKEDYSLYVIPIGVYFLLKRGLRRYGLAALIGSVIYGTFAFSVFLPFFMQLAGKFDYGYLGTWGHLGKSFLEIAISVLTHPKDFLAALSYRPLLNFGIKFLFLPFLAPTTLLFVVPPLLLNTSASHALIRGLSIHYGLIPATLAFVGVIEGLSRLRMLLKSHSALIPGIFLLVLILVGLPRFTFYKPSLESVSVHIACETLKDKQPLCVQSSLFPHLIPQGDFSIFPECSERARFLLVHPSLESYPLSNEEFEEKFQEINQGKEWRLLESWGKLTLFERRSGS